MTPNVNLRALGNKIKETRRAKGWSQEELAYRSMIDRSYVGGIERGERNISVLLLVKLAKALQVTVCSLVQDLPLE